MAMAMQVIISGSSPLVQYNPCRACDAANGWQSAPDFNNNNNTTSGTDTGFVTTSTSANVSITFTGTGLEFDLVYAPTSGASGPGAGAGTDGDGGEWNTTLLVNGTAPPSTATIGRASVQNLPLGTHEFTYLLSNTGKSNTTWAEVQSVVGTIGGHVVAGTTNATIDDSAWRSGEIVFTDGWNMLEANGTSNWLDENDYNNELETAGQMFNNSVSWTTQENASANITFDGSTVWAYGMTGGDVGSFQVVIDGTSRGTFNGAGGPRSYNHTLFFTSGLTDGPHTLQLVNQQGRLSLDRVVSTKGLSSEPDKEANPALGTQTLSTTSAAAPPTAIGLPTHIPTSSSSPSSSPTSNHLSTPQLAGVTVGSVVGVLLLTLIGYLLFQLCRRSNRPTAWSNVPWYKRCLSRDKGWRFAEIQEPVARSTTHVSTSSFGSTSPSGVAGFFQRKSARTDRAALPMSEVPSSPDPMAFALNNGVSPLTQLQRSYAPEDRRQREREVERRPQQGGQGQGQWSDWFGLSTYGNGRGSIKSGKSGGGMFGLGPGYSKSRDRNPMPEMPETGENIGMALSPSGYPPSPSLGRERSHANRYA